MTQFARPVANTSSTLTGVPTQTGTNLYLNIDESTLDTSDYIYSGNADSGSFIFRIAGHQLTEAYNGHVMRITVAQADSDAGTVAPSSGGSGATWTAKVMNNISSEVFTLATNVTANEGSWQTHTFNLSESQAQAVMGVPTNVLYIRFEYSGGGGNPNNRRAVALAHFEYELPDAVIRVSGKITPDFLLGPSPRYEYFTTFTVANGANQYKYREAAIVSLGAGWGSSTSTATSASFGTGTKANGVALFGSYSLSVNANETGGNYGSWDYPLASPFDTTKIWKCEVWVYCPQGLDTTGSLNRGLYITNTTGAGFVWQSPTAASTTGWEKLEATFGCTGFPTIHLRANNNVPYYFDGLALYEVGADLTFGSGGQTLQLTGAITTGSTVAGSAVTTESVTGAITTGSTVAGSVITTESVTGAITTGSTTSATLIYQWEWSLFTESSAISKLQPANTVGSVLATSTGGTLSVVSTPNTYGVRSEVTTLGWVEHDVILDKGLPNRTYRIEIVYRLTSGNTMMVAGGIFSWGSIWSADNGTATVSHYNEEWTPTELFLRQYGTNGTVDFNLYSTYASNFNGIIGEGVEWHSLHITEVRPDLFTESDTAATNPNCLVTTVENQGTTTGLTISGLTRTTRGFNSNDTTNEREWYQKKSIRANTTLQQFTGTGYVSMSTPTGALVVGEAYEFSMSISTNGSQVATLANWTGAGSINQAIQTPSQEFRIITQRFVATATTATIRLDVDGTVYTSGWRLEKVSDLVRTNHFTAFAGNADTPHATNEPGTGWHSANGGTYTLETTNRYKGTTAIKVTGNASNSYIWEDLNTFVTIGVGETARITGRYYVETASAGQDILIYNSGGSPGWTAVSLDQTYINRWVMFEVEYTRQTTALLDIEITAGTGTVYVDDLRFVNADETIDLGGGTTLQMTGAITTGSTVAGSAVVTESLTGAITTGSTVAGSAVVTESLTGAITAGSTVAGSATLSATLNGAISTASSLAASLLISANLSASVATSSTVAGEMVAYADLTGTVAGSSMTSGALDIAGSTVSISGTVATSSAVAGEMVAYADLTGAVATSSTVAGEVGVIEALDGAVATSSTVAGETVAYADLTGAVATSSAVAGEMVAYADLTGAITTGSTVAGETVAYADLTGIAAGSSVTFGALDIAGSTASLSGNITTSSTVAGSVDTIEALSGTVTGGSTISGLLAVRESLESTVSGLSTVAGDMVAYADLAGDVSTSSTTAGALDIAGSTVSMSGNITTFSEVAGVAIIISDLTGAVATSSTVAGALDIAGTTVSLSGTSPGSSIVAGDVGAKSVITGTVAGSSTVAGSCNATAQLIANAAGSSAVAGDITAFRYADGSTAGSSSVSGSLVAVIAIDGAITSGSTTSSNAGLLAAISGLSVGSSSIVADLTYPKEYKPLNISITGVKNSVPLITGQKKAVAAITGQKKSSIQITGKNVGT